MTSSRRLNMQSVISSKRQCTFQSLFTVGKHIALYYFIPLAYIALNYDNVNGFCQDLKVDIFCPLTLSMECAKFWGFLPLG